MLGGAATAMAGAAILPTRVIAAGANIQSTASTGLFDDVMNVIVRSTGVSRAAILSSSREKDVVCARQRGMYVYKLLSSRSYAEIGRRYGGRMAVTVLHALRKIEQRRSGDPALDREIDNLIHDCMVEAVRNNHRLQPSFSREHFTPVEVAVAFDPDNPPLPPWR